MVRITSGLIQCSRQFLNPLRDRELDLRGTYKFQPPPTGCLNIVSITISAAEPHTRLQGKLPLLSSRVCHRRSPANAICC